MWCHSVGETAILLESHLLLIYFSRPSLMSQNEIFWPHLHVYPGNRNKSQTQLFLKPPAAAAASSLLSTNENKVMLDVQQLKKWERLTILPRCFGSIGSELLKVERQAHALSQPTASTLILFVSILPRLKWRASLNPPLTAYSAKKHFLNHICVFSSRITQITYKYRPGNPVTNGGLGSFRPQKR